MFCAKSNGSEKTMRLTRIFTPEPLITGHDICLDADSSHHLLRVLRQKPGDSLLVFDGQGHEFHAQIVAVIKHQAQVHIGKPEYSMVESPLAIHLGQAISRGEKMDYTLQKAVELGVKTITPLFTERSGVKLSAERIENRLAHWRGVVISACEQSGRSYLPVVEAPVALPDWLKQGKESLKLLLQPGHNSHCLKEFAPHDQVCLLVGPEGGFSSHETTLAEQHGFASLRLGPRILRTETAAPAAITALQCLWGDMG